MDFFSIAVSLNELPDEHLKISPFVKPEDASQLKRNRIFLSSSTLLLGISIRESKTRVDFGEFSGKLTTDQ